MEILPSSVDSLITSLPAVLRRRRMGVHALGRGVEPAGPETGRHRCCRRIIARLICRPFQRREYRSRRLNEEIKRRTHVVRIFPNHESCLRLVRALAVETHENWLEQHRYLNMDGLIALIEEAEKLWPHSSSV